MSYTYSTTHFWSEKGSTTSTNRPNRSCLFSDLTEHETGPILNNDTIHTKRLVEPEMIQVHQTHSLSRPVTKTGWDFHRPLVLTIVDYLKNFESLFVIMCRAETVEKAGVGNTAGPRCHLNMFSVNTVNLVDLRIWLDSQELLANTQIWTGKSARKEEKRKIKGKYGIKVEHTSKEREMHRHLGLP